MEQTLTKGQESLEQEPVIEDNEVEDNQVEDIGEKAEQKSPPPKVNSLIFNLC